MSTSAKVDFAPPVAAISRWQRTSLIVGALGVVGSIIGWIAEADEFYRAFLLGYMWCIGLTLGCLAVLMLYHLTGGKWGTLARRILEAGTRTLPLMIVLFVVIAIGAHHLYPWSRSEVVASDPDLQHIAHSYLNLPLFITRAIVYFVVWGVLTYALNRISNKQDAPPEVNYDGRLRVISGLGIVAYAFTITLAAVDWTMSLDPRWTSTIWGLLFMAGQGLLTMCFVAVMGSGLKRYEPMATAWKPDQFLDFGKLMLAFTMLWGWFTLSQWLIYWSGNLPEEISWYLNRTRGGWEHYALALVILHFFVPFLLLLSRQLKKDWQSLRWIALLLIVARYMDLLWYIVPNFPNARAHFHFSWLYAVVPVGMAGLWLTYFFQNLKQRPLMTLYDYHVRALLEEDSEHEHAEEGASR